MIVVESPLIGVGKTEATKMLTHCIVGSKAYFEKADNEFLTPFYADVENNVKPSHWAFSLQFFYMDDRYFKHKEATEYEWWHRRETIHDRSIWGDHGFALKLLKDGFLSERDYRVYCNHRRTMENQLLPPHVVLHLKAKPETAIKRILDRMKKEGCRQCETAVTPEYLMGVSKAYDEVVWPWFEKNKVPVIELDWEAFPDINDIVDEIRGILPSTQEYRRYEHVPESDRVCGANVR